MLFYEMLTGRSAFPAPTEFARLAALLSSEPEPVQKIDPALAPLAGFFERALKKDRNERFSTAGEMARALAAAVPGIGGRASGPPIPLSRLPDVPSLFGPPGDPAPTAASPRGAGESGRPPGKAAAQASPDTAQAPVTPERARRVAPCRASAPPQSSTRRSTSSSPPPRRRSARPCPPRTAPAVDAAKAERSSPDSRRGTVVSANLVVVLVIAALAAGFLLGWAFGRM